MNIDKRLIAQIRTVPFYLAATVIAGWSGGVLVILQANYLSLSISSVFLEKLGLQDISPWLYLLALIVLLRAMMVFIQHISSRKMSILIKSSLRKSLFKKMLELGPVELESSPSGKWVTLCSQGIEQLDAYFSQYIPQLILSVAIPVTILIAVVPKDGLSGIILLLTAPLIPIFMVLIGKNSEKLTEKQWGMLSRLGAYFLESIQGLTTLKTLNQSHARSDEIATASESYRRMTLDVLRITFLSAFVLEMVATISTAVVAVQIGLRLLGGNIQFQQALFILVLAPEFYLPLRTLGLRFHAGMNGITAAKQIFEIIEKKTVIHTTGNLLVERHTIAKQEIRFDQVSFCYPNRDEPALKQVTFVLEAGKTTALIGASGAGKSTIFNLVLRFIEPTLGEIYLGKQPLQRFNLVEFRKSIAWVSQKPFLFNDTLAANIHMYGGISDEQLLQAARFAHLEDDIELFPEGYQTRIGEGGHRLSAGQMQRLALARAFYKDSPLLLLDEPEAFIDPQNAQHIQSSLRNLCSNRTTLIIAHHLDTIAWVDQFLQLERGNIISIGHPTELLRSGHHGQKEMKSREVK